MGALIVSSGWLLDLASVGENQRIVAHKVMRAQILNRRRRGHVMNVDTEYVRRRIAHAARGGYVPNIIVECAVCRWDAWLADWIKVCDLKQDQIDRILGEMEDTDMSILSQFMRRCPGIDAEELAFSSQAAPPLEER